MDNILKVNLTKTFFSSVLRLPSCINKPLVCYLADHYDKAQEIVKAGAYYVDDVTHGTYLSISFNICQYLLISMSSAKAHSPIVYVDTKLEHHDQTWWKPHEKRYLKSKAGLVLHPEKYVKFVGKRASFKKFTRFFFRCAPFAKFPFFEPFNRIHQVKPNEHDEPRCDCDGFMRGATCEHCLVWLHQCKRINLFTANTPINRRNKRKGPGYEPPVPGALVHDD